MRFFVALIALAAAAAGCVTAPGADLDAASTSDAAFAPLVPPVPDFDFSTVVDPDHASHLAPALHANGHGLSLVTPMDHTIRGSQVNLARAEGGYAIVQALIARGVIGDFRAPDILRFGFTPLYLGFEEVWHAVEHLRQVLDTREWQRPEFNRRNAVT